MKTNIFKNSPQIRWLFTIFFGCIILLICFGCAYVPSHRTDAILKMQDDLYIASSNGYIKTFDARSHRLKERFNLPTMRYGSSWRSPRVTSMISENDDLMIFASQYINNAIFLKRSETLPKEVATFGPKKSPSCSLWVCGKDHNYYYLNEIEGGQGQNTIKNSYRIDKSAFKKIDRHFDAFRQLVVVDSSEDILHYWYLCIDKKEISSDAKTTPNISSQLVLVSKIKSNNQLELIELGKASIYRDFLINEGDFIWIFSEGRLYKISKETMTIQTILMPSRLIPFDCSDDSNLIWAWAKEPNIFGVKQELIIYCIDKNTNNIVSNKVLFERPIEHLRFNAENYSDCNYLWLSCEISRQFQQPSGYFIPYLLRISKADLTTELLLIKPTFGEAIYTVMWNFFLRPFMWIKP